VPSGIVAVTTYRQPCSLCYWSGRLELYHWTFVRHLHYQRSETCSRPSVLSFLLHWLFPYYEQRTLYGALVLTLAMLLHLINRRFIIIIINSVDSFHAMLNLMCVFAVGYFVPQILCFNRLTILKSCLCLYHDRHHYSIYIVPVWNPGSLGAVQTCSQLPGWRLASSPTLAQEDCYWLRSECLLLVIWRLALAIGHSVQLDLKSRTMHRRTSDSQTCHAAVLFLCVRWYQSAVWIPLLLRFRNPLTYKKWCSPKSQ